MYLLNIQTLKQSTRLSPKPHSLIYILNLMKQSISKIPNLSIVNSMIKNCLIIVRLRSTFIKAHHKNIQNYNKRLWRLFWIHKQIPTILLFTLHQSVYTTSPLLRSSLWAWKQASQLFLVSYYSNSIYFQFFDEISFLQNWFYFYIFCLCPGVIFLNQFWNSYIFNYLHLHKRFLPVFLLIRTVAI